MKGMAYYNKSEEKINTGKSRDLQDRRNFLLRQDQATMAALMP
jgi:hypothetical protein